MCIRDSPDSVDAQTITALIAACQKGLLSRASFTYSLQRGGYLPDGKTIEEELEEAEEEGVPEPSLDPFGEPQNQPPAAVNG